MSIKLSPKHGVNPSVMLCFYCGGPSGIALPGMLKGDAEAPREAVWDLEPCGQCATWMKAGIILISTRDGERETDNPHRTGKFAVITEGAARKWIKEPKLSEVLKRRVLFVEDSLWPIKEPPPVTGLN